MSKKNATKTAAPAKKKAKTCSGSTPAAPNVSVIEIADESDDEPAKTGKRAPRAIRGSIFTCQFRTFTFARSVDREQIFGDVPKQPPLGNLATHLKTHGGLSIPVPGTTPLGDILGVSAASAKIMADFLREGELDPAVKPTQNGFAKVFAAWILEDDSHSPLSRLAEFSKFVLPGDTTVRNTLARIFVEMFKKLKADLKIAVSGDTWTTSFYDVHVRWHYRQLGHGGLELVECVLDFHPIEDKEHEGEYAGAAMARRLSELEVLEQISVFDSAATKTFLSARYHAS
ncbi:hypothetical protein B0H13DRAFT_1884246 [Mycena leptocephala]|nr:hypothetical protein B0H13DRAFT_1884246 [Mycena leptocephala]